MSFFNKYFFYISAVFLFLSCDTSQKNENKNYDFLLTLLESDISPKSLSQKLDSLDYDAKAIYKICQTIENDTFKMRLTSAIFHKVENYMQENNQEYWAAILYDLERFAEYVRLLKTKKHKSFLDVGSANGEKLFAALCLGFDEVYGIEYSSELVKISQTFFKIFGNKAQIKLHDALTIKGNYYQNPDFIYMYSPIRNNQKMAKLYYKIMQNMKENTILLEVRMVYIKELKELSKLNFPKIMGHFILKKQNGAFYYLIYGQKKKVWHKLEKVKLN